MHTGGQPGKFILPIGPQHPALKEPGHFEFSLDGEVVTAASVRLGYVHRGIEKAAEARSWVQNLYLLERVCGICSHVHALAYVMGLEKLASVAAPPRAQAIRTLFAELERIQSHLLWLGMTAHQAGFEALFMYAWRDREIVMDLLESLSGHRVHYSVNIPGGVKIDVGPAQVEAILGGTDELEKRTRHYLEVVTTDMWFVQRTRGIGVMSAEQAARWGASGPTARASGLARDVRLNAPYAAYAEIGPQMVVANAGDLEARIVVRLKELLETCRLIRLLLAGLPEGALAARMPRKIQAGEAISRVEAPRGELFYFIKSSGGERPERIKIRTPSIGNLESVIQLAIGHQLADVPMLLAGIDPCFSCNDRMVILNRSGGHAHWTWEALRQHALEHYGRPDHA